MIQKQTNWPEPLCRRIDALRADGLTVGAIADRIGITVTTLNRWYLYGSVPHAQRSIDAILRLGLSRSEIPPAKIALMRPPEYQTAPDRLANPLPDDAIEKAKVYDRRIFRLRCRLGLRDDVACLIATEMDEHPADWPRRVLRYAEAEEDDTLEVLSRAITKGQNNESRATVDVP